MLLRAAAAVAALGAIQDCRELTLKSGGIYVDAFGAGAAGDVNLRAGVVVLQNAYIRAQATGDGCRRQRDFGS